jgi:hypothetical protein
MMHTSSKRDMILEYSKRNKLKGFLIEMWGNHCEYIFTNRHYGNGGANGAFNVGGFTARLQGADWQNVAGGLNCNLNAIENHNPRIDTGVDC